MHVMCLRHSRVCSGSHPAVCRQAQRVLCALHRDRLPADAAGLAGDRVCQLRHCEGQLPGRCARKCLHVQTKAAFIKFKKSLRITVTTTRSLPHRATTRTSPTRRSSSALPSRRPSRSWPSPAPALWGWRPRRPSWWARGSELRTGS